MEQEVIQSSLKLKQPILYIVGEVDNQMYQMVSKSIALLISRDSPDISVIIDSPGGSTMAGLDIYDLIRLYPGKKTATVINKAASMGAIILQACDVRQCAKHSSVLIHHVSSKNVSLNTLRNKKRLAYLVKQMTDDQDKLTQILISRTGQSKAKIVSTCRQDKFMSADEALAFGLIDKII